ncbi:MAG TPA: hypothetical protein VFI94_11565 [Pseudolabrys sp.]|nr:hypothetical protein [Pseudolabrys sp.]
MMLRSNKAKFAIIAALALTRLAATPAFGQSFSAGYGTGNVLPFNSTVAAPAVASHHASAHAARRNGVNSFAMEPRQQLQLNADSPAATGGGSIGYNENLYNY